MPLLVPFNMPMVLFAARIVAIPQAALIPIVMDNVVAPQQEEPLGQNAMEHLRAFVGIMAPLHA